MTDDGISSVSFSIDKDGDFITYVDQVQDDHDDMMDFKKTIDAVKVELHESIEYSSEGRGLFLFHEILKITNRFEDLLDKVIHL